MTQHHCAGLSTLSEPFSSSNLLDSAGKQLACGASCSIVLVVAASVIRRDKGDATTALSRCWYGLITIISLIQTHIRYTCVGLSSLSPWSSLKMSRREACSCGQACIHCRRPMRYASCLTPLCILQIGQVLAGILLGATAPSGTPLNASGIPSNMCLGAWYSIGMAAKGFGILRNELSTWYI